MKAKINMIIIYGLLIGMMSFLVYSHFKKAKIVYVDNVEVFSSFKMKAELEKKYKEVEGIRKSILDSIYNEIRIKIGSSASENKDLLNEMKRSYLIKKESFEKENNATMTEYNEQIWNQINEYTKKFGEENDYEFILGANGQGVLMYAKGTKNVTKELVEYVNAKYNGK